PRPSRTRSSISPDWPRPDVRPDGRGRALRRHKTESAFTQPLRLPRFPDIGTPAPAGAPPWHPPCNLSVLQRRALPEKGKPAARRGRKATGQAMGLTAGLPKDRDVASQGSGALPQLEEHHGLLGELCLSRASLPLD